MANKSIYELLSDRAILTSTVREGALSRLESEPFKGKEIAPVYNTGTYLMKTRKEDDGAAWGIGQFSTPESTPQLIDTPGREASEKIWAMLYQDEEVRISPTEYEQLQSSDISVSGHALYDFTELGYWLAMRNERLTELKRWEAFLTNQVSQSVNVVGDAANVTKLVVPDYGIPNTHRVTAGTLWTDTANSDPVSDLKAWRKVVLDSTNYAATKAHITEQDLENALASESLKLYFNIIPGQPFLPTVADIESLVSAGRNDFSFVITEGGWRPMSAGVDKSEAAHTRYLPEGKILLTTNYSVGGLRIAETPQGKVDVMTGYNTAAAVQGPVAEFYVDPRSKQRMLRYASRVLPKINVPNAFLTATVA